MSWVLKSTGRQVLPFSGMEPSLQDVSEDLHPILLGADPWTTLQEFCQYPSLQSSFLCPVRDAWQAQGQLHALVAFCITATFSVPCGHSSWAFPSWYRD